MILRGAFEVARRDGLEALSMPTLASHLSVGITSIYWYFRSKEELVQQMYLKASEVLMSRIVEPSDKNPENWRSHLRQIFTQARSIYAEDNLLAELQLHPQGGRSGVTPGTMYYQRVEDTLAMLVAAGFTTTDAWDLYSTLTMFTHGTVTTEQARRKTGHPPVGEAQLALVDVSTMPLLSSLIREYDASLDLSGSTFAPGLDLILDAAEHRLSAQGATA